MRRMTACLLASLLIVWLVITGPARANQNWTAVAGGGTKDGAVIANAFFPKTIEVGVGDTIKWNFAGFHTVTFLSGGQAPPIFVQEGGKNYFNPQVFFPVGGNTYAGTGYFNSGTPQPDPKAPPHSYSLTFSTPGRFQYVCILHPGMLGTVVVKETGTAIGSPPQAEAQGRQELAAVLRAGLAAWAKLKPQRVGRSVVVSLTGNNRAGYSIMRFTREPLVIRRGTTVTWKMADPFEIHTVTFFTGKAPQPGSEVQVEPQQQGPPKLRFRPEFERPAGGKSYAGRGFFNSGILFTPPFGPPGAPSSYSLTFTKAGRYEYWCIVHLVENMRGVIVVR